VSFSVMHRARKSLSSLNIQLPCALDPRCPTNAERSRHRVNGSTTDYGSEKEVQV
jgi:hypothetical protein